MLSYYKQKASDIKRSFTSSTGSARVPAKAEALPKEFFSSLIENESEFRSNSYTVETLDVLVQLYARAVEYYDSIQDEISSYFTYKIQDILATKRSLKMLIDRKEQEKNSQNDSVDDPAKVSEPSSAKKKLKGLNADETPRQNSIQETLVEESSDEDGEKSRREEWEKKKEVKKPKKSVATLISQKQRFAQFYHMVEVEKDNYKEDMHILFNDYTVSSRENDRTVQKSINAQKQRIRQKLQQRKNNTFLAYTLNSTFNSVNSPGLSEQNFKKGDFNEDSILRELEDTKAFNESFIPPVKSRFKSQSLFMRKEESNNRSNNSEAASEFGDDKEEVQEKAPECLTPTEKFSTENSLTIEFSLGLNEAEASNKEPLKMKV